MTSFFPRKIDPGSTERLLRQPGGWSSSDPFSWRHIKHQL
jgi:hypothetical protein